MTILEQEIASAAARRSASMRRRVANTCLVCGEGFEGLTNRRYCSDRCRTRAAREHDAASTLSASSVSTPPMESRLTHEDIIQRPDEVVAEFLGRLRRKVYGDRMSDTDAAELIRQERHARSEHLACSRSDDRCCR